MVLQPIPFVKGATIGGLTKSVETSAVLAQKIQLHNHAVINDSITRNKHPLSSSASS